MQKHAEVLNAYFKQNPPKCLEADSVLETLYWNYTQGNPINNGKIRELFARLRSQFPHLSMQEFDPIFTLVRDLCIEHERLAFYEGLRLGVTLMTELKEVSV